MKKLSILIALLSSLTLSVSAQAAVTLTFDDLDQTGYLKVPDGYGGLEWFNFLSFNGKDYRPDSGYNFGTVSSPNIVYNGINYLASFSSENAFDLISVYVTKAWNNGTTRFEGYKGDQLAYSVEVYSTTMSPTFVSFNWNDVNKVVMSDGDGSLHSVIDNLTVSTVPEPETYGMLLAGLGVLSFVARRKQLRS